MNWLSEFTRKQGQFLLNNKWYALLHTTFLAVLPYTTWLSVAVIALITLRKGNGEGRIVLGSAMAAHFAISLFSMPAATSLINTGLIFFPCYCAAIMLRKSASWQAVAGVFLLQVIIAIMLIQVLLPDFIMAQYQYLHTLVQRMQNESALIEFLNDKNEFNQRMFANYLLGIQAAGIVFSASISLMLARSVQAKLYNSGGFTREMLSFRGNKIGLLLLVGMLVAANLGSEIAVNILPVLIFYFLFAGMSLGLNVLAQKKPFRAFLVLTTPLLLLPFVMLPVYVIFGSLDSLFNFRLYLPKNADKRI